MPKLLGGKEKVIISEVQRSFKGNETILCDILTPDISYQVFDKTYRNTQHKD